MSDRATVQLALRQTLENLQRCGLRWFPTSAEIPHDLQPALELLLHPPAEQLAPSQALADVVVTQQQSATTTNASVTIRQATDLKAHAKSPVSPIVSDNSASPEVAQASQVQALQPIPSHSESVTTFGQVAAKRVQFTTADGQAWQTEHLDDAARHNLFQILDQEIKACRKCNDICSFRQQTVFGVGPIQPTVCFMGEAPGADEDRQGQPFVGRAGQLLTRIIEAMKLKREEVYILNSLKCRPPGNRTPSPDEINNCYPFVETQLETLKPKFIVCLGAVAVRSLLKTDAPVGQLRGRFFSYRGARVLVTYHPSYLLRNESAKKLVWEDMQILMRELGIETPKKK